MCGMWPTATTLNWKKKQQQQQKAKKKEAKTCVLSENSVINNSHK